MAEGGVPGIYMMVSVAVGFFLSGIAPGTSSVRNTEHNVYRGGSALQHTALHTTNGELRPVFPFSLRLREVLDIFSHFHCDSLELPNILIKGFVKLFLCVNKTDVDETYVWHPSSRTR